MKRLVSVSIALFSLTACSLHQTPEPMAKKPQVQAPAMASADTCQGRAQSRLSLFDKPDTFPISEEEKRNVYLSLYNECMKEYEVQVATAKPNFTYASQGMGAELAGLAPAAGGNNPSQQQAKGGIITYPNGTMVIDTAMLSGLSPSAGGQNRVTGITNSGGGQNGSTVVVVQAPSSAAAVAYPAPPTRASAIAVEDTTVTPTPAAVVAAPAANTPAASPSPLSLVETEAPQQAAPVKKKTARKPAAKAEKTAAAKDGRTRFQRDAVAVDIDLRSAGSNLNQLQPSAGHALDSSINTNKLPAKD